MTTVDYDAFVREVKKIEAEWLAASAEAAGKQAVIDGAVKVLEQAGCTQIEYAHGDPVGELWGWTGDADPKTFHNRVFAAFRTHILMPLRSSR